jgi:hypothetical protein
MTHRVTKAGDERILSKAIFRETPMRNRTFLASLTILAALATPAAAFRATNGFTVDSIGPQEFVVNFRTTRNETAYWCAAGDFVIRELGLSSKTRIYRASPKPRGAGQGITFTLNAAAAAPESGISTFSRGGSDGSVSAGHARGSYCSIYDIIPFN